METQSRRPHQKPGGAFALDQPWTQAGFSLLYSLLTDAGRFVGPAFDESGVPGSMRERARSYRLTDRFSGHGR